MSEHKTALERVESTEKEVQVLQGNFTNLLETQRYLVDRGMSIEQSLSGLAKTLAGLVKALEKRGVITDKEVLSNIRGIDDDSNRDRIKGLLANKIIASTETVTPLSLVVVTQHVVSPDGTVEQFSGYRILELPSNTMDEKDRANLVGKSRGETIEHKGADGRALLTKIKEIYNAQETAQTPGEAPAVPEVSVEVVKSDTQTA